MADSPLAQLQRRFKADIQKGTSHVVDELRPGNKHSSRRRLDVYRNTISQLISFIAEDHPILGQHLGGKKLNSWIEEYLRVHPSTSTNKADISARFHKYVRNEYSELEGDIATFDWCQVLSSAQLEDARSFTPIAQLQEEDMAVATLVLDPTLQLFASRFAVHQDNTETPTYIAIRYIKNEIEFFDLGKEAFFILQEISNQKSLPEIITDLAGDEIEPEIVSQCFMDWVKDGTIIGFIVDGGFNELR